MSKCEITFIEEADASCECSTIDDLRKRIEDAERDRPDIPRGRLKECAYLIGCTKGWTKRGTVMAISPGEAHQKAKAIADAHERETGHSAGVLKIGPCISVE